MPFVGIGNILGDNSAKISDARKIVGFYENRTVADGGVVESIRCVRIAFVGYNFKSQYQTRVALDGGVAESVNCFYRIMQDLYLMN